MKKLVVTSDDLVLDIPMKPHLVKFLQKLFGSKMRVTRTSWFGLDLVKILSKDYQKKPQFPKSMSRFRCVIPKTLCDTFGHFPEYDQFPVLENKLNKIFTQNMIEHIELCKRQYDFDGLNSIMAFFDYYGITEDDYKLETAYRQYMRYKKESVL